MILKLAKAALMTVVAGIPVWALTAGAQFVPVTPCRVVDTRNADGPFGGPSMTAGSTRSFAIPQSTCNIPSTATAYALNVTVVPHGGLPYLTLWPTGQDQPYVSTLNSFGGIVVANAAIVPAGTGGAVSVFVMGPTDVILDINGYFEGGGAAGSYAFYPATPCRVADTRNAAGTFGGPSMTANQTRSFPIPESTCQIPSSASAYSLNVTAVPSGASLSYLTAWPTGESQPNASTLNSWTGKVVANAAIVPAGTNGAISTFVTDPTDVVLDINGYFGQPGNAGMLFYPVTPCRVADTRNADGPFGGPEITGATSRSFNIPASACSIPSTATAYSMNVTVVPAEAQLRYLTTWPTGEGQPFVSTLNSFDGSVVANAAIVPAGTGGAISVFVTEDANVVLDINGYFAPAYSGPSLVAERALVQEGMSIGLAAIVLQSQVLAMFGAAMQAAPCQTLTGGGSVNSGSTPITSTDGHEIYPVTVYYDNSCTQTYITADMTSLNETAPGSGTIVETATYYGLTGTDLGPMTLNETILETDTGSGENVAVNGLGLFTPTTGLHTPVQLGLYCDVPFGGPSPTVIPCTGAIAQDFPALNVAIGSVTSLTLTITDNGTTSSVSFVGNGTTVTGPIGTLTATNPTASTYVIQGGTPFGTTTGSGSAPEFALFPPTPTSWTLTDTAHDLQLVISVIDNTTRDLSITITQISTGQTVASGTLDHSGTGSVTYSDGSNAAVTSWALAD